MNAAQTFNQTEKLLVTAADYQNAVFSQPLLCAVTCAAKRQFKVFAAEKMFWLELFPDGSPVDAVVTYKHNTYNSQMFSDDYTKAKNANFSADVVIRTIELTLC